MLLRNILLLGVGLMLMSQSALNQPITSIVQTVDGLPALSRLAYTSEQTQQALARLDRRIRDYSDDYEARLLKGLLLFYAGEDQAALHELNDLTRLVPDFHLAYLIQGDILAARGNQVALVGHAPVLSEFGKDVQSQLSALKQEAWARLQAYLQAVDPTKVPLPLLQLAPSIKRAILVDKSQHRLYVFEREGEQGIPQLVRDFYVSTGKLEGNKQKQGDLRTPEGVYFITSHIPQAKLPDKYGVSAFPVDYPNAFDQHLGKTGDGIWLHGTERIYYSRPPLDSEGCVVMTNRDLKSVEPLIAIGSTPIIIADKVKWVDKNAWQSMRSEVATALEDWRKDWESRDVERYLNHYSANFWNEQFNFSQWKEHKSRVNLGKTFQKVELSDVSFFSYPVMSQQGEEMVLVSFRQDYHSNNFNSETSKRVFFTRHNGSWKILYEGR